MPLPRARWESVFSAGASISGTARLEFWHAARNRKGEDSVRFLSEGGRSDVGYLAAVASLGDGDRDLTIGDGRIVVSLLRRPRSISMGRVLLLQGSAVCPSETGADDANESGDGPHLRRGSCMWTGGHRDVSRVCGLPLLLFDGMEGHASCFRGAGIPAETLGADEAEPTHAAG
jgi:hypothetical protein